MHPQNRARQDGSLPAISGERGEFRVPLAALAHADGAALRAAEEALTAHLAANPDLEMLTYEDWATREHVFIWGPRS